MVGEMIHTSVPRGVRPGSRGFCTAAVTIGLPPNLIDRLEALSGYRDWLEKSSGTPKPAALSHIHLRIGGAIEHIVSRVAPAPNDYTGRANKIAHHRIFDPMTRPPGGPAWLLRQPGLFRESYDTEPALLEPMAPPSGEPPTMPCRRWEELTSDAGWAGQILERWLSSAQPLYLLYPPRLDALGLVEEMLALVPPADRWKLTFSTVYSGETPSDVSCQLRMLPLCDLSQRFAKTVDSSTVVRLDELRGQAGANEFAQCARTGQRIRPAVTERRPVTRPVALPHDPEAASTTLYRVAEPARPTPEYELETRPAPSISRPIETAIVDRRFRMSWSVLLPVAAILITTTVLLTAFVTRYALKAPVGNIAIAETPAPIPAPGPVLTPERLPKRVPSETTVVSPAAPNKTPQPNQPTPPPADGSAALGHRQVDPGQLGSNAPANPTPRIEPDAPKANATAPGAATPAAADPMPLQWAEDPDPKADRAELVHPFPNDRVRIFLPSSLRPDLGPMRLCLQNSTDAGRRLLGAADGTAVQLSWKLYRDQKEMPGNPLAKLSLEKTPEGRFFIEVVPTPNLKDSDLGWFTLSLNDKSREVVRLQLTPSEPQPIIINVWGNSKSGYGSNTLAPDLAARLREVLNQDFHPPAEDQWTVERAASEAAMPPKIVLEHAVSHSDMNGLSASGTIRLSFLPTDIVRLDLRPPKMSELPATDLENLRQSVKKLDDFLAKYKGKEKGKEKVKVEVENIDELVGALQAFSEETDRIINFRRFEEALDSSRVVRSDTKGRVISIRDATTYVRVEIRFPPIVTSK